MHFSIYLPCQHVSRAASVNPLLKVKTHVFCDRILLCTNSLGFVWYINIGTFLLNVLQQIFKMEKFREKFGFNTIYQSNYQHFGQDMPEFANRYLYRLECILLH